VLQECAIAQALQFSVTSCQIIIRPKLVELRDIGDGKMLRTYANGVQEEFSAMRGRHIGTRLFPDGKKEQGEFDGDCGALISGCRTQVDGSIQFVNPRALAAYLDQELDTRLDVCFVEDRLQVLELINASKHTQSWIYTRSDVAVESLFLRADDFSGHAITAVLTHDYFEGNLGTIIEHYFESDVSGAPRFFKMRDCATTAIIKIAANTALIDPLAEDPVCGMNLFTQAAYHAKESVLKQLIELFPQEFLIAGRDVIAELLMQRNGKHKLLMQCNKRRLINEVVSQFTKLGGELDAYHTLWSQVVRGEEPDEKFWEQFSLLDADQKQPLYDAAFTYNNPHLHEPSNTPILPHQYSINLMWINKHKLDSGKKFLLGQGCTFEQQEQLFHEGFVKPVAAWARKNPGSFINIWVDGNTAPPQVMAQSEAYLDNHLHDSAHGKIQFMDVRTIDIVRDNAKIFCDPMPLYFRVDLLRAIAADYILRERQSQFFVYGDLDMQPLSAEEIFDRKTVRLLDEYGFVMAKHDDARCFENGFQILNGEHTQFMESHREVIINLNTTIAH